MSGGVQSMSIEDVSNWLLRKGFPVAIADAFRGEFFLASHCAFPDFNCIFRPSYGWRGPGRDVCHYSWPRLP